MTIERLKEEKSIWIYGQGQYGRKLFDILEGCGINVEGFIVSNKSEGYGRCRGKEVLGINEMCHAGKLILVAVSDKHEDEIKAKLDAISEVRYKIWNANSLNVFWKTYPHLLEDRKQNKKKVLFVIIGYKAYLWDEVIDRVTKYIDGDTEVCLCSSGLYSTRLSKIARNKEWSYLSTNTNSLTIIQNIAISIFDKCELVIKMDEDIFLTEGAIARLEAAYYEAVENDPVHIGIMAPLIPLNEYGCRHILLKYGRLDDFEKRFGRLYQGGDGKVVNLPGVASYMWGRNSGLPTIDDMERDAIGEGRYVCGTRFNIGLVLFDRSIWRDMRGFTVSGGIDLGRDEEEMCSYCINSSKAIVVTHDTVVGHFAFGPQTEEMRRFCGVNLESDTYSALI